MTFVDMSADIKVKKPKVGMADHSPRVARNGRAPVRGHKADHRFLAEAISRARGYMVDPAKVALKLAEMDTSALYQEAYESVEWELWDKDSPINGVMAADVLSRPEYAAAKEIYLIRVDGKVVIFQPFKPGATGFDVLEDDDIDDVASEHCAEMVALITNDKILRELDNDAEVVAVPAFASLDETVAAAVAAALETQGRQRPRPRRQ